MKIIYSPSYSGSYYVDLQKRKNCLLGLKVCGSRELLSELELRAGIASQELSEPEQLIDFHKSLNENISGTIFEKSFRRDEVGVSRQLMAWCNSLLMEGWTPDTDISTVKFRDLSKIVRGIEFKPLSTRWSDLAICLKNHRILQKDDLIEVHDKDLVPAVIRTTLDELAKQATVRYVTPEGDIPESIEHYHFKSRYHACRWYLSKPEVLNGTDVTISSDNCVLNNIAMAMAQPVVNSTATNSNPQLLQLFKLGMSLFARPLNVYNLLSYLQVPGNPLGGVSYKLARVLSDEGGINDKWKEVIKTYDFTDDDSKDKRADKLAFIEMLDKDYESGMIPVDDVKMYASKLAHWCDQQLHSDSKDDERKEQLVVLASFCRSLYQILPADGYIPSETLKAHVDGIYRPQSFTHMKARKNSPNTVASVTQLADDANKVCWLGCVGGSLPVYPFDFLNTSELNMLHQKGISIPSRAAFYTQHHHLETEALKHIKNLILVTWDFDGNARQEEHPLVTELKHRYKDSLDRHAPMDAAPNLNEEQDNIIKLEPQASYTLSDKLKAIKREKESYSSISTLIQHPFDYTITHLLRLNEPQIGQLPDLDNTKGLVAHRFIELLFGAHGEQMADQYSKLKDAEISQLMDQAILQKGAILLLPEYKLERQQFLAVLKESVTMLISIIKNLDFKWSEAKHFVTDLEENKAMQLELYREAAQKHYGSKVVGVAYYLFPMMTLFTTDFPESSHIRLIKVKTEAGSRKLYKEVQNSYEYRREELDRGFIEESEMTEIAELAYAKAGTTTPLYPLNVAYNTKDLKSCPYLRVDKPPFAKKKEKWNTTKADLKEIKTTHPILKNRLV